MYVKRLKRQGYTDAQIEEWLGQGYEPPCARDAYIEHLDQQHRKDNLYATLGLMGAVLLMIVLGLILK